MVCNNTVGQELEEAFTELAVNAGIDNLVRMVEAEVVAAVVQEADRGTVGLIGEETAAAYVQTLGSDVAIVSLSDSHSARSGQRLDLDMVAAIDSVLVVIEVKTRRSGTTTRAGNLTKPQTNPPGPARSDGAPTYKQGSDGYNQQRLKTQLDLSEPWPGVETRVIKVDLTLMQLQQFAVDANGKVGGPIGPPVSCVDEASLAIDRLRTGRGIVK